MAGKDSFQAKDKLGKILQKILSKMPLSQQEIGQKITTSQTLVSQLTNGIVTHTRFSKLLDFMILLGYDINITISPSPNKIGEVEIHEELK